MNNEMELWLNPALQEIEPNERINGYWFVYMQAANNRYMRFLPFTAAAFPETAAKKGIMESPLVPVPSMKDALNRAGAGIRGNVFLKNDAALPVYGSTWARGGMHAVLQIAEHVAQKAKMLSPTEKYGKVNSEEFRELYSRYTICVPKEDDFGRSARKMAEKLGFRTMTGEAETLSGTTEAPAHGAESAVPVSRENTFVIDPSSSEHVYFGIASAAMRLRSQLRRPDIEVDKAHPLFLYIPCESGMIPSAITFGLKQLCLNHVHCFFVEKAEDPAVREYLIRQAADDEEETDETEKQTDTAAEKTDRVSDFACDLMKYLISGSAAVDRESAETCRQMLEETENITLPAASCTGFAAMAEFCRPGGALEEYADRHALREVMDQVTHIIWNTGGSDAWN